MGNMINHELPRQVDYDCRKCYINNICKHYENVKNVYEAICSIENVPEHCQIRMECMLLSGKDYVKEVGSRLEEMNERLMRCIRSGFDISSKQDSTSHFAANGVDPVEVSVYNEALKKAMENGVYPVDISAYNEALKKAMENPEQLEDIDEDKALKKAIARLKDLKDIDADDAKMILDEKDGVSDQSDFAKMLAKKHGDESAVDEKKVNKVLENVTTEVLKKLDKSPAFEALVGKTSGDAIPTYPIEPGCKEYPFPDKTCGLRNECIPPNCVGNIGSIKSESSGISFFDLIDKHNNGTCINGKEGE